MNSKDRGFTLIELLIVVAIISIIAAFAVPGLLQGRASANEASAITSLKATSAAQIAYSTSCGNGGYATSFLILGTPPSGVGQAYISADLGLYAAPQKAGYNFTLTPGAAGPGPNDCMGRPTSSGYLATAIPQTFGSSGSRSFALNAESGIWQSTNATPPAEPFTASATTSPIK